jgi:hypothetical protein
MTMIARTKTKRTKAKQPLRHSDYSHSKVGRGMNFLRGFVPAAKAPIRRAGLILRVRPTHMGPPMGPGLITSAMPEGPTLVTN